MKRIILEKVVLGVILIVALVLRFYKLGVVPPALFADEAVNIASARAMMTTGKDLQGKTGLYFSDAVESRPPLYGYLAWITTSFFGERVETIRLPAVILGIITIGLVFGITKKMTKSKIAAFAAAAILALSPWHFHYCRVGWEPAAALPFLMMGVYFGYLAYEEKRTRDLLLATLFLGLGAYAYQASPMWSVLFYLMMGGLIFESWKKRWRVLLLSLCLFGLMMSGYIWRVYRDEHLTARAQRIFTFAKGVNQETGQVFTHNYLKHWSLDFLIKTGDPNIRHNAGSGEILPIALILAIIGVITLPLQIKNWFGRGLLLGWGLIYPLASALTNDGVPHATRSLIGAPWWAIMAGLGTAWIFQFAAKRGGKISQLILVALISGLLIWPFTRYLQKYFNEYPKLSATTWEYGNKEVLLAVAQLENLGYKRACLANLTYWNQGPLLGYYLPRTKLQIWIDPSPQCSEPETIVVTPAKNEVVKATLQQIIMDYSEKPLWKIWTTNRND